MPIAFRFALRAKSRSGRKFSFSTTAITARWMKLSPRWKTAWWGRGAGTSGRRSIPETTRVVEFNDLNALEDALKHNDVACILAEPAMTNVGIILPDDGYWKQAQELAKRYGSLFIADETHTICAGPGGCTAA